MVRNRLCCLVVKEFLATDPEVPGSIPGPTTFSEKYGVWNGGPVRTVEELLG
jgi:hypothetical protein